VKTPIVRILVTIPSPELFDACTLVFPTLRTGFPDSTINVTINGNTHGATRGPLLEKIVAANCGWDFVDSSPLRDDDDLSPAWINGACIHHAAWIRNCILEHARDYHADKPLVILDSDCLLWDRCDNWEFQKPLAGYYVPRMWNDFAKCVSFPRVHTSFLYLRPTELLAQIKNTYSLASEVHGEYCPCDPFMPAVKFIDGKPYFWDSTSVLYNMVGASHFTPDHLKCYDHLNSASFRDVMVARMDDPTSFKLAHDEWVKDPNRLLRNLWPLVNSYYRQKEIEGRLTLGPIHV